MEQYNTELNNSIISLLHISSHIHYTSKKKIYIFIIRKVSNTKLDIISQFSQIIINYIKSILHISPLKKRNISNLYI